MIKLNTFDYKTSSTALFYISDYNGITIRQASKSRFSDGKMKNKFERRRRTKKLLLFLHWNDFFFQHFFFEFYWIFETYQNFVPLNPV